MARPAFCLLLTAFFFLPTGFFLLPGEAFRPDLQKQLQLAVELPVRHLHLLEQDQGVAPAGHQARFPHRHRFRLALREVAAQGLLAGVQLVLQEAHHLRAVRVRDSPPFVEFLKHLFPTPVGVVGAIERLPQRLVVHAAAAALGEGEKLPQDVEDLAELARRVLLPHQPALLHLRLDVAYGIALAGGLPPIFIHVGPLELAQLDRSIEAVELAELPEIVGEAVEEHPLQGRAGRIGVVQTLAQALALGRVLVEFPHQLEAALGGVVAVLETVLAGDALAHLGRRSGGLLGVSAIGGALPLRNAVGGLTVAGVRVLGFRVDQSFSGHSFSISESGTNSE
ncbi:MAG: hypothetical protein ACLQOO_12835 [Terriglobia bacterium]